MDHRSRFSKIWDDRFAEMQAFAAEHGRPPKQTECRLGMWATKQRVAKRESRLSSRQVARLESIPGWAWSPFEAAWNQKFDELGAFVAEHGSASATLMSEPLNEWANYQRTCKKNGSLSAERSARLESVPGWMWRPVAARNTARNAAWDTRVAELEAFVANHGRFPKLGRASEEHSLAQWVKRQRRTMRNEKLSADRIARLESVPGWVWSTPNATWDARLAELEAFAANHGRFPKPLSASGEHPLAQWVIQQRFAMRNERLSTDRIARLESVPGWVWGRQNAAWDTRLAELEAFAADHSRLPKHGMKSEEQLAQWMSRQRKAMRNEKLSTDRITRLESIPGWVWSALNAAWDTRVAELEAFVVDHGRFPKNGRASEEQLAQWVNQQRRAMRNEKLSVERIARLESIPGWVWSALNAAWDARFAELEAFVADHGRFPKNGRASEEQLAQWVKLQRSAMRNEKLSTDRVARLESVPGWVWSAR